MTVTVITGGFFGDEGKGKIAAYLALKDRFAACVRAGVGPNAGHTVTYSGRICKLRLVPSGFINPHSKLFIGPGVLLDVKLLLKEVEEFNVADRLIVDSQCGIIEDKHLIIDRGDHLKEKIGTTGTGTGPANADRALRDCKIATDFDQLNGFVGDVPLELGKTISEGHGVLVEGSQGTYLSLYHGTYPYVTSKDVTASGACADVGLGPRHVEEVILVFKSYVTRVGSGPLEGEISPESASDRGWREVGTVTGRQRRAAPFDFKLARRACLLNSASQIALTKFDVIFPRTAGCRDFSEMEEEAKLFVEKIEFETGIPVTLIGTGPDANEIIDMRASKKSETNHVSTIN